MMRGSRRRKKGSVILHVSRPVKTILQRLSFFVLAVASVSLIIVSTASEENVYLSSARIIIIDAVSPVVHAFAAPVNMVTNWNQSLDDYMFVHDKNLELAKENDRLQKELIALAEVKAENERLKDLLKFVEEQDYNSIAARVVGNASGPFLRSILINAGAKNHVQKGQAVVSEKGLVGRIIEVGANSARVLLVTDINAKVPVISSISRERSIMAGNNTDNPTLMYLPENGKIHNGEVIMTSGDGALFPAGLPVGTVYAASGGFKVQPFTEWHRLEHLSVLEYGGEGLSIGEDTKHPEHLTR